MTVQEAIEVLSEIRCGYNCFDESERPFYEALSEAIEALTHFNSTSNSIKNELNDDLISRQDAIDALWEKRQALNDIMDKYLQDDLLVLRQQTKTERNRIEEDINIIEELPSAQPERKKGEWIPTKIAKPLKAGQYLVTKQQKTGACQIATAHYNPSFDEWSGNGNFKKILAWQPLPSPYTQE